MPFGMGRLYRETHATFEEYCLFTWGYGWRDLERLMNPPVAESRAIFSPPSVPKSCVYFIECVGHDLMKIGFSDSHPKARFRDLQIACPFELRIVATIQGATVRDEKALHKKFTHLWFRVNGFATATSFASLLPTMQCRITEGIDGN